MKTKYAFLYVVLGMVLGTIIFGTLFYFLDKSKGWNPFGWWFIATFAYAILSGLIGLFLFGYLTRKTGSTEK